MKKNKEDFIAKNFSSIACSIAIFAFMLMISVLVIKATSHMECYEYEKIESYEVGWYLDWGYQLVEKKTQEFPTLEEARKYVEDMCWIYLENRDELPYMISNIDIDSDYDWCKIKAFHGPAQTIKIKNYPPKCVKNILVFDVKRE